VDQPEFWQLTQEQQTEEFRGVSAQMMEAVFESLAELVLQTYVFRHQQGGDAALDASAYYQSVALSAVSIIKAIVLFWFSKEELSVTGARLGKAMTNTHVKALVDGMAELGKDGPTQLDLRSQKLRHKGFTVEEHGACPCCSPILPRMDSHPFSRSALRATVRPRVRPYIDPPDPIETVYIVYDRCIVCRPCNQRRRNRNHSSSDNHERMQRVVG
jgi:hypothetical protein